MTTVWYTTREAVKAALDVAETARADAQVDRAIESASRAIDGSEPGAGILGRRFYPEIATRTFDWPNDQRARLWRMWLDGNELISVTLLVSGGVEIPSGSYFLRPDTGPPFTHVEVDMSTQSAFGIGSTWQRSVSITGTWGYSADTTSAGTLAAAVSSTSATTINVSDSNLIQVGHIVKVDSERMIVTGKAMLTTSQTVQTPLTASQANVTVAVTSGSAYAVGETVLLDSERMLIVDIAGNNLTVKRAYDGSVLATHTGSTIYAPRTLTVTRGALGTTAATHSNAAAITVHVVPGLVADLCLALTINRLNLGRSAYADTSGTGSATRVTIAGKGLNDLREDTMAAYGRRARIRAV